MAHSLKHSGKQSARNSPMTVFKSSLSRWHLKSFLWIYVLFTIVIAYCAYQGITEQGSKHTELFILTTLGSITGPMIGAISREFQGCCLGASQSAMKLAAPVLLLGILLQTINFPKKKWIRISTRVIWVLSWIFWFLIGLLTFGHALV